MYSADHTVSDGARRPWQLPGGRQWQDIIVMCVYAILRHFDEECSTARRTFRDYTLARNSRTSISGGGGGIVAVAEH